MENFRTTRLGRRATGTATPSADTAMNTSTEATASEDNVTETAGEVPVAAPKRRGRKPAPLAPDAPDNFVRRMAVLAKDLTADAETKDIVAGLATRILTGGVPIEVDDTLRTDYVRLTFSHAKFVPRYPAQRVGWPLVGHELAKIQVNSRSMDELKTILNGVNAS